MARYPISLIKTFFAMLRKEYHIEVNRQTKAKDISKAINRQKLVTQQLVDKQKKNYGLIKLWKHSPEFKGKVLSQRSHVVYSKSKAGKGYVRLNTPWTEPQRQFVRERSRYSTDTLYHSFAERFGDIRTKSSVQTMRSRLK